MSATRTTHYWQWRDDTLSGTWCQPGSIADMSCQTVLMANLIEMVTNAKSNYTKFRKWSCLGSTSLTAVWPDSRPVTVLSDVTIVVTIVLPADLCSFLLLSKLFFVRNLFNNREERRHGDVGPGLALHWRFSLPFCSFLYWRFCSNFLSLA